MKRNGALSDFMSPEATLVSVASTLHILGLATWGHCSSCLTHSTYHNSFVLLALVYEFMEVPPTSVFSSIFLILNTRFKVLISVPC